MKKQLPLILTLLLSVSLFAQSPDKKWSIGYKLGSEQFAGYVGEDFSGPEDSHFINGLTLSRRISSHFDLGLSALWGEYEGHYYDEYYCEDMTLVRDLTLFNLNAKFHLFKYDDVLVRPFVFAGFGLLVFDDEDFEAENILDQFQYPDLGLGLNIKVSPTVNITFDETLLFIDRDRNSNNKLERYLQHAVGVSFNLGKSQDTDNDGISDRNDACPEVFGLKQFEGCPDSDSDGVKDSEDNCPNEAGLISLSGCPEEVKKQDPTTDKVKTSAPKVSLYVVNFECGNSNINKTSKSILNSIVDVLKKNPNYKLDIKGYTDTDGDENMNLRLSDSRAKIVKKYLTKRGISDKRLFTKGYGEQNPIADNNTEEGKAKNRRVELNFN
jgi:outer membrane protein OmpA-like peptidoglycan-associated protein